MDPINVRLKMTDGARRDLERLNVLAERDETGAQFELLKGTVMMLDALGKRRHPTKFLEYDSRFGDLSDCETTYVGVDPNEKPPLRIVSQDVRSPTGGAPIRRIIAIGPRQDSAVYRVAANRLQRPPGVTLEQLEAVNPAPKQRRPIFDAPEASPQTEDAFQL